MSVTPIIVDSTLLTAVPVTQGTPVSNLAKRIFKAATITNTTAASITVTVYLVPSGGVAAAANTIISARPVAPGETYLCPELVGQGQNAGGFLQAAGNGLTFKFTAVDII